jgi:hypothetical protein
MTLFEEYKHFIVGASAALAGVFLLIFHFNSASDAMSYVKAESAFSAWEASPENEKLYAAMRSAMASVPALGKKHEAAIAQKLIEMEKIDEALIMAQRSLRRVKEEAPFHVAFAENSLLIEKGKVQQALENAVALKERMVVEKKAGVLLYAYNLLRIASLQRELQNRPGEKAGLEELQLYLKKHKEIDLTGSLFEEYIAARKAAL